MKTWIPTLSDRRAQQRNAGIEHALELHNNGVTPEEIEQYAELESGEFAEGMRRQAAVLRESQ